MLKVDPHEQRVPRSQRGGEIIEPMVSTQWFVQMHGMPNLTPTPTPTLTPTPTPTSTSIAFKLNLNSTAYPTANTNLISRFVQMQGMADASLEAVKTGEITIIPNR